MKFALIDKSWNVHTVFEEDELEEARIGCVELNSDLEDWDDNEWFIIALMPLEEYECNY